MVIKKHISTLESLNFHSLLDESLLEPYVSKGTRTVLRRGKESNFSPLSDVFALKYVEKAVRTSSSVELKTFPYHTSLFAVERNFVKPMTSY